MHDFPEKSESWLARRDTARGFEAVAVTLFRHYSIQYHFVIKRDSTPTSLRGTFQHHIEINGRREDAMLGTRLAQRKRCR
jgi:hypothetical protein